MELKKKMTSAYANKLLKQLEEEKGQVISAATPAEKSGFDGFRPFFLSFFFVFVVFLI